MICRTEKIILSVLSLFFLAGALHLLAIWALRKHYNPKERPPVAERMINERLYNGVIK